MMDNLTCQGLVGKFAIRLLSLVTTLCSVLATGGFLKLLLPPNDPAGY